MQGQQRPRRTWKTVYQTTSSGRKKGRIQACLHSDHTLHTHTHSRIKAKGQAERFRRDVRLERKTGSFLFKFPLMWSCYLDNNNSKNPEASKA